MTTGLDLTNYGVLSFDCYGTLIDWEAGIAAVLAPWAGEQGLDPSAQELLRAYAETEAVVERDTPSALYPDVLAMAFRRTGERLDRTGGLSVGPGSCSSRTQGHGLRRCAADCSPVPSEP